MPELRGTRCVFWRYEFRIVALLAQSPMLRRACRFLGEVKKRPTHVRKGRPAARAKLVPESVMRTRPFQAGLTDAAPTRWWFAR